MLNKSKTTLLVYFILISVITFPSGGENSSITHSNFPAYEVGDIVIFGPAGTSNKKIGHSALLLPREFNKGEWQVRIIDSMPEEVINANSDISDHGSIDCIITTSNLQDGTWSEWKQQKRKAIVDSVDFYKGKNYLEFAPPQSSDIAWYWLSDRALDEGYYIQPDSIYADPPGTHDYEPRQKGAEVDRYTCSGFTETVYESCGFDLTPSSSEHAEGTYYHEFLGFFDVKTAHAYIFFPKAQADNGFRSQPKGPEVEIIIPAKGSSVDDNVVLRGEAKDVSGLRKDKIMLRHLPPSGSEEELEISVSLQDSTFEFPMNNLSEGVHSFMLVAYDKAGNLSKTFVDGSRYYFTVGSSGGSGGSGGTSGTGNLDDSLPDEYEDQENGDDNNGSGSDDPGDDDNSSSTEDDSDDSEFNVPDNHDPEEDYGDCMTGMYKFWPEPPVVKVKPGDSVKPSVYLKNNSSDDLPFGMSISGSSTGVFNYPGHNQSYTIPAGEIIKHEFEIRNTSTSKGQAGTVMAKVAKLNVIPGYFSKEMSL